MKSVTMIKVAHEMCQRGKGGTEQAAVRLFCHVQMLSWQE